MGAHGNELLVGCGARSRGLYHSPKEICNVMGIHLDVDAKSSEDPLVHASNTVTIQRAAGVSHATRAVGVLRRARCLTVQPAVGYAETPLFLSFLVTLCGFPSGCALYVPARAAQTPLLGVHTDRAGAVLCVSLRTVVREWESRTLSAQTALYDVGAHCAGRRHLGALLVPSARVEA